MIKIHSYISDYGCFDICPKVAERLSPVKKNGNPDHRYKKAKLHIRWIKYVNTWPKARWLDGWIFAEQGMVKGLES